MKDSILLCHNLLEKIKNLITKVVGKSTGRQFKFYLDMTYGILKSKSIILNDIAHALNEDIFLKKTNKHLYTNLMRIPDINDRHSLIKVGLSYMRKKEKVFIIDDTNVINHTGKHLKASQKLGMLLILASPPNTIMNILLLPLPDYPAKRNNLFLSATMSILLLNLIIYQ